MLTGVFKSITHIKTGAINNNLKTNECLAGDKRLEVLQGASYPDSQKIHQQ